MAEDDTDTELENTSADMKVDDTILKLAEQYVGYENRARQLNKDKAAVREQADKIGIPSLAWQMGVRMVKIMDLKERRDFERGFKRVTTVLSKSADTLFPEDIERQKKRASKKAEKAAKEAAAAAEAKAKSIEAGDDNPRSDPKRGGAGRAAAKKTTPKTAADRALETSERNQRLAETQAQSAGARPGSITITGQTDVTTEDIPLTETGDELIARVAREKQAEQEQREGAALLDAAGKPKAQSAIAAEKLAEAKLT